MAGLADFGPWQGLSQLNSFNRDSLAVQRTASVAIGAGLVAGTPAAIGAAIGVSAPAGGSVFVFGGAGVLGMKFVGGTISGMTSAAMQGKGPIQIGQQGLINGVVSVANPGGPITSSPVWAGAINSATANAINQLGSDGQVNWGSVLMAGAARGMFGYMWVGSASNSFADYTAQGMVTGAFSGSAGILTSATAGM